MTPFNKTFISTMLACALFSAAPSVVIAAPQTAAQQVKVDYQTFTLPNGLTTIVYSEHSVPNVFVGVWYKVGSKDEPAGKTGFAHLFEHLMFQPTVNRQDEYFLPLDKVGATGINGTTHFDRTNYYQTVPSNALDLALWMESDRMANLAVGITQQGLDEQRFVVKNEKRQGELAPGSKMTERYLQNYYPAGHPYSHSVIGSMEDLDNATLDDVKQWFNDYYGANNAVLVLAGDIDLETAKAKVGHYFSDVKPGKPLDKLDQWLPVFSEIKRDIAYDKVPTANVSRVWPLPNNDHKDTALMQLVAMTLADSKSSPLYKILVDDLQLAMNVGASVTPNELSSTFTIYASLKPGITVEQINPILDNILQTYYSKGPDKAHLASLILNGNIAMLRSLESNATIGEQLIEGYLYQNDPLFFQKQMQWATAATPKELKQLAQKWLDKPYYESQLLPSPLTEVQQATVDRSSLPLAGPFKGKVTFPAIEEAVLSNGLKIVVAERKNLPIVDISMQFNTGSLAEDKYGVNVAKQAFDLLFSGTKKYSATEFETAAREQGVSISSRAGARQSSLSWGALSEKLDVSFKLAAEAVRHPSYPQTELDKIIANIDASYDAYERNPLGSANAIYQRAMWGEKHPSGEITRREQAKVISRQAIVDFHQREIGPNNATLYLIGDITLAQAVKLAEKHFGNWKTITPTDINQRPAAQGKLGRIILIDAPDASQSSIAVGQIIAPFNKDSSAVESLMTDALGGSFHSRLNMNLREDKGWAYGFSAGIANSPVGQRVFTASGSVQADKTAESMVEIKKEISAFISTAPHTEQELARDKAAQIFSIPSAFTSGGAFLNSMIGSATYGLPYNRAEGAMQRLDAVTLADARTLAAQTFKPEDLIWVIAGDLQQIETQIRALNFGEVEVWDVYGNKVR